MSSPAPRRVALLRFSSLGDVVLTSPAVAALHRAWPHTEIYYVIKSALAPLVRFDPAVHRVVELAPGEGVPSLARRLRALRPHAVLDLHGKMRSRALQLLVGGRWVRWVKRPAGDNVPVRLGLRPYRARARIATRYHRAVEALVGRALPAEPMRLHLDPAAAQAVAARLPPDGQPWLGISPGANWATKRWPVERFRAVAQRAAAAGWRVLVTGDAGERDLAQAVVRDVPGALCLAGELSLSELVAVVARCRVFLANDSGPMHVARALRVPTVTLFGSTDPAQFDFTGHRLLYAGVACAPCHFYGRPRCPRGHFACMTSLEAEGVWQGVAELGAGPERAPAVQG